MAFLSRISAAEHEDGEDRMPLSGLFEEARLRPLDDLVEEMRPMVSKDLTVALRKSRKKAREVSEEYPALTEDERAVLVLYTIEMHPHEKSFYYVLNEALRARDRAQVKPWRDVIWLLLTAMRKLPSAPDRTVQRGVKKHIKDLGKQAVKSREFLWSAFTSTTTHVESLQDFLGQDGDRTKWLLQLRPDVHAVSIKDFSLFPGEHELLLPPNMEFKVKSVGDLGHGLTEVQCEQIEETDPLMDLIIADMQPSASAPSLAGPIGGALKKAKGMEPSASAPILAGPIGGALKKAKAKEAAPEAVDAAESEDPALSGHPPAGSAEDSASGCPPDPAEAKQWFELGIAGGGVHEGQSFTKAQCYAKAIEADPKGRLASKAWRNLGLQGGGVVFGETHSQKDCFLKALEFDPKNAAAWNDLGVVGGGTVAGQEYTPKECYLKALELDPKHAPAWHTLGIVGGGTVAGKLYSKKECYLKALEFNPKNAPAWNSLGFVGGGTVAGKEYSRKECYLKALDLDPTNSGAWNNMGWYEGGGTVGGHTYSRKDCYVKALELDPKNSNAWDSLGTVGGGLVAAKLYSDTECYQKSLELNPNHPEVWTNFGNAGGGTVAGHMYSAKDCYQKALELDPNNKKAQENLAKC